MGYKKVKKLAYKNLNKEERLAEINQLYLWLFWFIRHFW